MHLAVGRAIAPVGDHRRTGLESPDSRGRGHSKTLTATSSLPATTRVAHHLAERARAAKLTARAISAGVIAALGILAPSSDSQAALRLPRAPERLRQAVCLMAHSEPHDRVVGVAQEELTAEATCPIRLAAMAVCWARSQSASSSPWT